EDSLATAPVQVKASLHHLPVDARFLGGQKVLLHLQAARGCRVYKENRPDVDVFEK
ncbi:hypothetical protein TNCV_2345131, partial [Trichonephila clavipes]